MELLHRCRDHAHKFYGDLFRAAEKSINDALFQQAEQCTSNDEQRRFFEAMQALKNRAGAMQATFRQELAQGFQAFERGTEPETSLDQQIDMNRLSLVNREELEDDIAISVIVSKSNSRNSENLWKLNRRMAVLRGGKPITDETNPLGPAAVCQALQRAMAQLNLDSRAKILIYKQLGKIFILSFAKELEALNALLVEGGILPNLRFSVSKSSPEAPPATTAPAPGEVTTPAAEKLVEPASAIANQQQLYNAIRELQSHSGPRTHTAGGVSFGALSINGTAGVDSFSPVDYSRVLSAIQHSREFLSASHLAQPLSIDTVEETLFNHLADVADDSTHQKMTRDDADTVDLVGMIFRYMLDDSNLHDSVKSILSHLHTPYLKLALLDSSFLDNYQHSARLLLNGLAEIGGRWVREDNDRNVLPKIKAVVEKILRGFDDNVELFDQLLEDLSRYRDGLEKRAKMVEKRNTEAQQGLERLELAKQKAADELATRLQKFGVSEAVGDLLRQPWTDFLAFNLLRHGDESLTWQSALKVLDGVIRSVSSAGAGDSREDFHRRQSELETAVAEGLSTIGYDPEASKGLLSALRKAHRLAFEEIPPKPEAAVPETAKPAPARPQPRTKPKSALRPEPPPLTAEEQSMVEKLKEIAFGTWFEFDESKTSRQLKLAWFSRVTRHYMFVDQTGVKQAVKTQIDLAKGMCSGTIRIVKPTRKSFMERALGAVLEKLKLT